MSYKFYKPFKKKFKGLFNKKNVFENKFVVLLSNCYELTP